ncbi:MAG: twin-arginine translocase subunit TatB [Desulfovibrionaceae bacterium]|nr:twin-arginine translocase subunit TatB [Desulfovibrionaceae bacterium]
MFGIGSTELLVILLVGLIVLGPKSLASLSRTIGKVVGEFRRVSTDFQRTLNAEAAMEEQKEAMAKMPSEEREQKEKEFAEDAARREKLAERRKAAEEKAAAAKAEEAKTVAKNDAKVDAEAKTPTPPPDSPLAKALAKTKAEAEGSSPPKNAT